MLVVLHPGQDRVQRLDRIDDVRALVEHHALGAFGHRGVSDLGSGWLPGAGERVEDLRGPDDRYMGGFAGPQNLLLDLGESFEAHFDGEVAAGDHDAEPATAHRGEQQFGEVLECGDVLDLQHDPDVTGVALRQFCLELLDVSGSTDERQIDHVGVPGDEVEVAQVLLGEGVEAQIGVGDIDAFARLEVDSAWSDIGDSQIDLVGRHRHDHTADLSVVEPDPFTGLCLLEHLGKRAADAVLVAGGRGCGGFEGAGEDQVVTTIDAVDLFDCGELANGDGVLLDCCRTAQREPGRYVGGLCCGRHAAVDASFHDCPVPNSVSAVDEFDAVTGLPAFEPTRIADGHDRGPWRTGMVAIDREPHESRNCDGAETVATR